MEKIRENFGVSLIFSALGGAAGALANESVKMGLIDAALSGAGAYTTLDGFDRMEGTVNLLNQGKKKSFILHSLANITEVTLGIGLGGAVFGSIYLPIYPEAVIQCGETGLVAGVIFGGVNLIKKAITETRGRNRIASLSS